MVKSKRIASTLFSNVCLNGYERKLIQFSLYKKFCDLNITPMWRLKNQSPIVQKKSLSSNAAMQGNCVLPLGSKYFVSKVWLIGLLFSQEKCWKKSQFWATSPYHSIKSLSYEWHDILIVACMFLNLRLFRLETKLKKGLFSTFEILIYYV